MSAWHFGPSVSAARATALLQPTTFGSIVEAIEREAEVLCCHCQPCDEMDGFFRVVFNLRVDPATPTMDLFFNSEYGYRGAFFKSPHAGLAANEACVRCLTPMLLSWAEHNKPCLDQILARESLGSPTAKVWLTEVETHLCPKCEGEWKHPQDDTPEILNGRWEDVRCDRRGRKAPQLTKLRIFGAFLNDRFDEFTPARKRHRAQQLHECGWT